QDDQGLAAGQFAAFYSDSACLGSGKILDSWDEMSFPVCAKALETTSMKDKSKLGKPVRIMNLEHLVKPDPKPAKVA
uniref:tRNA-specific 2-thiouridylase MnmA-like C-terminal domain-containing protein n=1 Tax=Triticum urartu TaxID=4572 RepID=A0A8R7UBL8_TRIUA